MGSELGDKPTSLFALFLGAFGGGVLLAPFVVAMLVLVIAPYVAFERRFRDAWTRARKRTAVVGTSPYRRVTVVTGADRGAPWLVRTAALASLFVGHAWVGLALLLLVVLADAASVGVGLGALLLPLVVVLARTWWSGARLLRPDAPSQRAARHAARWLASVSLPIALASAPLLLYLAARPSPTPIDGVALVALCAASSAVLLGNAALVARATRVAATYLPPDDERAVNATRSLPVWLERLLARRAR